MQKSMQYYNLPDALKFLISSKFFSCDVQQSYKPSEEDEHFTRCYYEFKSMLVAAQICPTKSRLKKSKKHVEFSKTVGIHDLKYYI